ncbi:MAG: GntR family transcriptional regulator, partial [Parasphingorhabdus sp.]
YQGFQEDGLVTVKRGVGMFVASGAKNRLRQAQREDFVKNIWPPVERQMKRLDLSIDDLLKSDA